MSVQGLVGLEVVIVTATAALVVISIIDNTAVRDAAASRVRPGGAGRVCAQVPTSTPQRTWGLAWLYGS